MSTNVQLLQFEIMYQPKRLVLCCMIYHSTSWTIQGSNTFKNLSESTDLSPFPHTTLLTWLVLKEYLPLVMILPVVYFNWIFWALKALASLYPMSADQSAFQVKMQLGWQPFTDGKPHIDWHQSLWLIWTHHALRSSCDHWVGISPMCR